ncbi:sigma-54 dependent transcriptional regulator [uncultured Tepidimonas sp.]|uniref:sigma-54-dependent transcriptional regulator n=1 Tax=uncultured Tepidimonas sp. TaxID=453579 RepID=UPI002616D046|nr:sigma-54 dependent transcriptional regulator [uncultured Tepidimonas sp.]
MSRPLAQPAMPTVLIVDDEQRSQEALRRTLEDDFTVITASSADDARCLLEEHPVHVILCDQRMPGQTGVQFLREVRERWPDVVRIIISGYADSEEIIAGVNEAGIHRYILKPWLPDHLLESVRSAVEALALQQQTARLDLELRTSTRALRQRIATQLSLVQQQFGFDRLVRMPGSPLDGVCAMAERVARYDISVLLQGESGTGKELLARAIHYASPRCAGPFVVENCAAIPDTLLESELFGHKRGAFTGAFEDHVGLFQRANGGTIFLDEIGETSPAFQVKLLRVLQEGEVRPVGAARPVPVDVRIIAATHRDLEQRVREGLFREDLYYRIAAVTLTLPPLRERVGDIPAIARQIVQDVAAELGHPGVQLSDEALACLLAYPWPGNIRELRNELARAMTLHDGAVLSSDVFSLRVRQGRGSGAGGRGWITEPGSGTLSERLEVVEAMILRDALLRHRWNKTRTAAELGLSRVGLRAKMRRFGLDHP